VLIEVSSHYLGSLNLRSRHHGLCHLLVHLTHLPEILEYLGRMPAGRLITNLVAQRAWQVQLIEIYFHRRDKYYTPLRHTAEVVVEDGAVV
jgi:hypothetical protein